MTLLRYIVARDRPVLHESLKLEFAGEPDVQILLDRRLGQRRRDQVARAADRRGDECRTRTQLEAHLRSLGWVIVDPEPQAGAPPTR